MVDTGVFGAELAGRRPELTDLYAQDLERRRYFVSFVTVAESRFGARLAAWGPGRLRRLEDRLGDANVVWPGPELVEVYADLRVACVRRGHALGQKDHEADRWVAATAIWLDVPLVHHDAYSPRSPDSTRSLTYPASDEDEHRGVWRGAATTE